MNAESPYVYKNSDELCAAVAADHKDVICAFSMGKDSLAAYFQLSKFFERVHPVWLWLVPGLGFQLKSLEYYESALGKEIMRLPSPFFLSNISGSFRQPIWRVDTCEAIARITKGRRSFDFVWEMARRILEVPEDTPVGLGCRSSDTPQRRISIKKNGAVNYKRATFFPVFDWKTDRVLSEITGRSIKLPPDYRVWGRTFDGVDYPFLCGLYDFFPDDYEIVKFWFPFIDAELLRY